MLIKIHRGLRMKLKPLCFATNRRDNSLICQKCEFFGWCLWERKDREYKNEIIRKENEN